MSVPIQTWVGYFDQTCFLEFLIECILVLVYDTNSFPIYAVGGTLNMRAYLHDLSGLSNLVMESLCLWWSPIGKTGDHTELQC